MGQDTVSTKHACLSTTQIVGTLTTCIILTNIVLKQMGKPAIELTAEEYTAIATVVGITYMQVRRFFPQKPLHVRPSKKVTAL